MIRKSLPTQEVTITRAKSMNMLPLRVAIILDATGTYVLTWCAVLAMCVVVQKGLRYDKEKEAEGPFNP